MADSLTRIQLRARRDLLAHADEFDAIVTAGDMHGISIGALVAAELDKPLMIVCTSQHECVVSHIVTIGDVTPDMRYLYVDDFFAFGHSLQHVFTYMNQSDHAPIVATYEACKYQYRRIDGATATGHATFGHDANGAITCTVTA